MVTPLFKCRCGAAGRRRTLCHGDVECARIDVCDACLAETDSLLDRVRPVFAAMLAADVDREVANDVMTELLNRMSDAR